MARRRVLRACAWFCDSGGQSIYVNDPGQLTWSITVVERVAVPEEAVTVIIYGPAGVPCIGLTGGGGEGEPVFAPAPQDARKISARVAAASTAVAWRARARFFSDSDTERKAAASQRSRNSGGTAGPGVEGQRRMEERAVVAMASAVLPDAVPAGSEGAVKEQLAAAGRPEHVNVSALGSAPPWVARLMVNVAVWPAFTVCGPDAELMLKSLTARASADEVPPPGDGFDTVIESIPVAASRPAGTGAVREVAVACAGVSVVVFTWTELPVTKFVPVRIRLKPALPTRTPVCERDESVGTGFSTGSERVFETPPPGAGSVTVMESVPVAATSAAGMEMAREVAVIEEGVRVEVFTSTEAPLTNPVPAMVSVNVALPARTLAGERDESTGTGLFTCKGSALEVTPFGAGLKTVMESAPAAAMAVAGMVAVSEESVLKTVTAGAPFAWTAAEAAKFVPVTERTKAAPPAMAIVGEIEVSVGGRLGRTWNWSAFEVPPPGRGLTTEIRMGPVWATSAAGIVAVTDVELLNVVFRGAASPT